MLLTVKYAKYIIPLSFHTLYMINAFLQVKLL